MYPILFYFYLICVGAGLNTTKAQKYEHDEDVLYSIQAHNLV